MKKQFLTVVILLVLTSVARAEDVDYNPIPTSVQMLNIAPEARGSAMGDAGVASTPDINSQHWNPAKYAFMDSNLGASLSITPWLRKLVSDINLFYAVAYYKIDQRNTVSASLRYFSLGDLVFYNDLGNENGSYKPNEFALDAAYAILLAKGFSGSVAMRYIHSDLGYSFDDDGYKAGNAFAVDLAFFYTTDFHFKNGQSGTLNAGINFSNIGTKITYDDGVTNEYLPANLRLGAGFWYKLDKYNTLGAALDFNKLLVPTPTYRASEGEDVYEEKMKYYDKSVIGSLFTSFGDAPGGAKEEFQEIDICAGLEYIYNELVFARVGYHNNSKSKGNLKYATVGIGVKYSFVNLDVSYLFSIGQANSNSALANTIRITLGFDIGMFLK